MTNKFLFPALALGVGVGAFAISQSYFSQEAQRPRQPPSVTTSDGESSTKSRRRQLRKAQRAVAKTVIRRHKALPVLSPQEEVAQDFPRRTNNMRNMIGLSLSDRRDELKGCVAREGLQFSTSTVRFHVESSSESLIATMKEVIAVPDSLRQCIAAELGTYEIAAEDGAPFLDGYSDTLDISLTINEPTAPAG